MANLQRLLTRRPHIDEAEVEDVRERTMARLAALNGETAPSAEPAELADSSAVATPPMDAVPDAQGTDAIRAAAAVPAADEPAPVTPPTPTGPKIIVPRTISLGPPEAPGAEPEAHHSPSIIVLGAPEPVAPSIESVETESAVEAEPVVAEVPIQADAVTAEVEAAIPVEATAIELGQTAEPIAAVAEAEADPEAAALADPIAEPVPAPIVEPTVEPVIAKSAKPEVADATSPKPKATKPKSSKPKATAPRKRPATSKPAPRPATAIPVIAEPEPVIEPGAVWPGQWLRDMSPDQAVPSDPDRVASPSAPRRDPAQPAPRVEVVADDWDQQAAAPAEPVAAIASVAPQVSVAIAEPEPSTAIARSAVTSPEPTVAIAEASPVADPAPVAAKPVKAKTTSIAVVSTHARTSPPAKPRSAAKPPTKVAVARPPVARPPVAAAPALAAFCPYCALALEPPPTASRRCARCKQRIVVKRVQGRVVYLTEAAVEVFESERIRSANFGRWSKERAQWLKLARSVHADPGRIERLAAAPLSVQVVSSAKTLYTATAERQYREAKRDDRWEDASRLKRAQAGAMHRLEGSPASPAAEVLAMYREAVATELRGIGKMAKEAAMIGSDCCEACRADDGRTFKIAAELRTPRLPHDGCPKGLCHCRWDLTIRDRDMVQRYLRRTVRPPKAKRPSA